MRPDLILTMRDIHINSNLQPLKKFTSSSRSSAFKDILPWNISQMITKTVPISTRIVISYQRWNRASWWEFERKSLEIDTWSEFSNGGKVTVQPILTSQERKKSKRAGLRESRSGIWVRKLTIWVRSFEIDLSGLSISQEWLSHSSLWWMLKFQRQTH